MPRKSNGKRKIVKRTVRKVLKKIEPLVRSAVQAEVEGDEYWINRALNDTRRDWFIEGKPNQNWIEDYWSSQEHPHRSLVIEALKTFEPFDSVFEIGCNCGPNLSLIRNVFPNARLGGIDLNSKAVELAHSLVAGGDISVGNARNIPAEDDSFDVVLSDAVLIYIPPQGIRGVIEEMLRVARRGLILVEWFNEDSVEGVIDEYHWCRNYPKLLQEYGLEVETRPIPLGSWPTRSGNWERLGRLFIVRFLAR